MKSLSPGELRCAFFIVSPKGPPKGVNYHPIDAPSKESHSLSLTSVKEGNITLKVPFLYENGTDNSKLDAFFYGFVGMTKT